MKLALTGADIFDGFKIHQNASLLIDDNRIIDVLPETLVDGTYKKINLAGGLLCPGFIDLQINGGGGVLLNNTPTEATMLTMANAMAPYGVTRIMPTVISDDVTITQQSIEAAKACQQKDSGILGIHIEGPFFNQLKSGVHKKDKLRSLEKEDWEWLESLTNIPAIVTLAPEKVATSDIEKIVKLGIRVCAGHTNALYEEVVNAYNVGLSGFTHLFNAMSALSSREPGVVGAALSLKDTWTGIIADGKHVHPSSIHIALQAKGFEKIFLVSDGMATVGSNVSSFQLYGETIEVKDGQLVNAEGRLAGSAITLLDAVKYCITTAGIPVENTLAMASRIPAEFMQLDSQYGSFKKGNIADICWLNDSWQVQKVWRSGKQVI